MENKSIVEYIKEMPFLLKVIFWLWIIPASLNAMYDLGHLLGDFLKTVL